MLDFAFMWEHIGLFTSGVILTLEISLCGIALAIIIELVCACVLVECEREIAHSSKIKAFFLRALHALITSYVELARNTPLLIQLFFLLLCFAKSWHNALCLYLRDFSTCISRRRDICARAFAQDLVVSTKPK